MNNLMESILGGNNFVKELFPEPPSYQGSIISFLKLLSLAI